MSTDYRPRPGAVPTAVVEDLAKLPPVAVFTSPSLRSAIDTAAAHHTRSPQLELPNPPTKSARIRIHYLNSRCVGVGAARILLPVNCALRTRPPVLAGMQPFHADVAITSAFNGLPSVFDLTAPLDEVPPTWGIKSMSRRCVGPERASILRFPASAEKQACRAFPDPGLRHCDVDS